VKTIASPDRHFDAYLSYLTHASFCIACVKFGENNRIILNQSNYFKPLDPTIVELVFLANEKSAK
jgi:hypothetical protein